MEKNKRKRGDRKEGRYLRDLDPYYSFTPFIMKDRNDSSNYFWDSVEVTELDKFFRKLRLEGMPGIGMLHMMIACYIRTASQCPGINRFVSGQRIYARNDIEYVMSIKKELAASSGETSIKVKFQPTDTLIDVYQKINAAIADARDPKKGTSTDDVAAKLMKLPRFILRAAVSLISWADYHGLLPMALLDASPFHGSFIITDLGSVGIPPIVHHLYNFGNLPVFIAFGAKRKAYELNKDGQAEARKYIDIMITTDERICDGYYYAKAFRHMLSYIRTPEQLLTPPESVVYDAG